MQVAIYSLMDCNLFWKIFCHKTSDQTAKALLQAWKCINSTLKHFQQSPKKYVYVYPLKYYFSTEIPTVIVYHPAGVLISTLLVYVTFHHAAFKESIFFSAFGI